MAETVDVAIPAGNKLERYGLSKQFLSWLCFVTDFELDKLGYAQVPGASYFIKTTWIGVKRMDISVERSSEMADRSYSVQAVTFFVKSENQKTGVVSYGDSAVYMPTIDNDLMPDFEKLAQISIERAAQEN